MQKHTKHIQIYDGVILYTTVWSILHLQQKSTLFWIISRMYDLALYSLNKTSKIKK
jgi:hypothetical protein